MESVWSKSRRPTWIGASPATPSDPVRPSPEMGPLSTDSDVQTYHCHDGVKWCKWNGSTYPPGQMVKWSFVRKIFRVFVNEILRALFSGLLFGPPNCLRPSAGVSPAAEWGAYGIFSLSQPWGKSVAKQNTTAIGIKRNCGYVSYEYVYIYNTLHNT